jgi:hypothetical protein
MEHTTSEIVCSQKIFQPVAIDLIPSSSVTTAGPVRDGDVRVSLPKIHHSNLDLFIATCPRGNVDPSMTLRPVISSLASAARTARCAVLQSRSYRAAPRRFGRYDLLPASSAMEAYPDPLAVPDRIPRPDYVPESFWSDPWSEVVVLEDLEGEGPLIELGGEEEKAVRRVGMMAAEVMSGIGRFIQVRHPRVGEMRADAGIAWYHY